MASECQRVHGLIRWAPTKHFDWLILRNLVQNRPPRIVDERKSIAMSNYHCVIQIRAVQLNDKEGLGRKLHKAP